ncbi:hypothetical protein [Methylobacter svalbardensis]
MGFIRTNTYINTIFVWRQSFIHLQLSADIEMSLGDNKVRVLPL